MIERGYGRIVKWRRSRHCGRGPSRSPTRQKSGNDRFDRSLAEAVAPEGCGSTRSPGG
ncbi:MAG: hypothetical protein CM1200mP2_30750 [Planctomycetaceae bacterium]|nr:MAG: hypothetical protein CM1200mP2_30750 [Planctomycetaceae bacterium]